MKFGQLLEESMRPDWVAHYFNYKVLPLESPRGYPGAEIQNASPCEQRGKEYALNRMDTVSLKEFIVSECSKV